MAAWIWIGSWPDLAWLGGELGAARDADVLADGTLPKVIEACLQETDLLPLRQLASTIAGRKRRHAAEAVASVRYSRLMLSLVGWLQALRWHESLEEDALGWLNDAAVADRLLHEIEVGHP